VRKQVRNQRTKQGKRASSIVGEDETKDRKGLSWKPFACRQISVLLVMLVIALRHTSLLTSSTCWCEQSEPQGPISGHCRPVGLRHIKDKQESLTDAKVSARQQSNACMWRPLAKKSTTTQQVNTICDFLLVGLAVALLHIGLLTVTEIFSPRPIEVENRHG